VVASEAWQGDNVNTFTSGFPGPGAPSPLPNVAGVYIDGQDAATATSPTMTTGMFIALNGNTTRIDGSVSGNTQTFMIYGPWKGGPYKVQINYVDFTGGDCSGTTIVTHGASSHTFSGTPCGAPGPGVTNSGNGAIFADGNIVFGKNSPDVVLEGDYAFTTPDYKAWPVKQNDITLNGNLTYDPKTSSVDKVSLWANNVIVNTFASNITVDAAIIAGYPGEKWDSGNFRNNHCLATNCGGFDQGTLTIFGSLVENARGAVGPARASRSRAWRRGARAVWIRERGVRGARAGRVVRPGEAVGRGTVRRGGSARGAKPPALARRRGFRGGPSGRGGGGARGGAGRRAGIRHDGCDRLGRADGNPRRGARGRFE